MTFTAGARHAAVWDTELIAVRRSHSPEERLLVAVLTEAVLEFQERAQSPDRNDDPNFQRLRAWFCSEDRDWPFSFDNLCDQLDLNPTWIRRRLVSES